jgi:RNA polymerase sigma-70 factor, ECF subfamily
MPSTDRELRSAPRTRAEEERLIADLRTGDEAAFGRLIDTYTPSLLRVATAYTGIRSVAEEVVQETWLGVLNGIDRFERRCSLKTWIFKILTNTAMTRGERERRSVPFSALAEVGAEDRGPTVDPDRFQGPSDALPGHWSVAPTPWEMPEERLLSAETRDVIMSAIQQLPTAQRVVITMRDVEGWAPEEVCQTLEVSDGNQRVLLHRARAKVRTSLERYFGAVEEAVQPRNAVPRAATTSR